MSVGTGSKVKSGKYLALAIEIKVKNIGCCIRHCQYQRGYIGFFLVYLAALSIRAAKSHLRVRFRYFKSNYFRKRIRDWFSIGNSKS